MSVSCKAAQIAEFFERLAAADEVLRTAMSHARLSARLIFRGEPERAVLLDLRPDPLRIVTGDAVESGMIEVAIDADVMHEVLLGRLHPGVALARRELLLRGSAAHLARFIPLFDLAPALYAAHVETAMDTTELSFSTHRPPAAQRLIAGLSYGIGFTLGWLRRTVLPGLDLFAVLAALSRGLKAGGRR